MEGGHRIPGARPALDDIREHARAELAALPARLHRLELADPSYRVEVSPSLAAHAESVAAEARRTGA